MQCFPIETSDGTVDVKKLVEWLESRIIPDESGLTSSFNDEQVAYNDALRMVIYAVTHKGVLDLKSYPQFND